MIKYAIAEAKLAEAIATVDPRWAAKAGRRTKQLISQGHYAEKTTIWSLVKPVFMTLQLNKCVFCERQFESPQYGTIEFDLEHFRPKSTVVPWPDPERHPGRAYSALTGAGAQSGYFWLAYDPLNYAASCKVCNTTFKLSYFPVAAERGTVNASVADLALEQAWLCYPIGDQAEDPETLITFVATIAVPTHADGAAKLRGQIIIDFFGLNEREQLHRDRARMISLFGPALLARAHGQASASDLELIACMEQSNLPHAGCLRAYKRLWTTDPALAHQIFEQCRLYMLSEHGSLPPTTD